MTIAYSLILAGAVGNLIDRFRLDYVIDFFDFYYDTWHFPAFNVADSAITVGGALLVLDYILELKNKKAATHGS
jgi:signal peptidase II